MAVMENPALKRFVAEIGEGLVLAQVLIQRNEQGYELRHIEDREEAAEALKQLTLREIRALAQSTAGGAFRPLKSAPNLSRGWRLVAAGDAELESALNQLYPGAVADWYAVQLENPRVTNYREFTNRQSGMYRITALLGDPQAAQMIKAGCHQRFCLKRRLWTVEGLETDAPHEKSLIPCLEPCAVLMEFARKVMRIEQQERVPLELSADEVATLERALEVALSQKDPNLREGDVGAPENPRRLQLLLQKLKQSSKLADNTEAE